jgi:hypothetical protein
VEQVAAVERAVERAVAVERAAATALATVLIFTLVAARRVAAQDRAPSDDAVIAAFAADLASEDHDVRARGILGLSTLPERMLPAIRTRLGDLRNRRPPPEEALPILHELRRAAGSRRADDLIDIAPGVTIVLAARRDRPVLRMVEPVLLQRSLERIATTEALALIPEVLRLDRRAWEMEGRRVTLRLGDRAAAAILLARSHDDSAGREWARWSIAELQLADPGRLVQRLGPRDLADVLAAWGGTRTMDAMSVVASYVDDSRRIVRDAARGALRDYGQNGIWQTREQFRLRLGESANEAWGWQRTLAELERRLDARRLEGVADLAEAARVALDRGDPRAAGEALDTLLARAPDAGSPDIAALFARTADLWLDAEEDHPARVALERAIRLSPADPERARWEARLSFVEAEAALQRGVLDLEAYRRAAAGDPSCERCGAVRARLEAQARPPEEDGEPRGPLPLMIAAALLALLGIALLARPGVRRAPPRIVPAMDSEVDTADATLPG